MIKKLTHILILLVFICLNIKAADNSADQKLAEENKIEDKDFSNANVTIKINDTKPDKNAFKKRKPNKVADSNSEDIYLNFENASLSSVVNYLSELKKINIIPEPKLDGVSVTLTTRKALTLDRAWDILQTLLDLNAYTMINVGGLYRIVAKDKNKQEPLPVFSSSTGTEPENLPDSDLVIRYIYFLQTVKAQTIAGILDSLLEKGSVQANPDLEALIITEKCLNIKSAMKIVKELDQGGLRESIKIILLKNTNAEDVEKLFKEIIPTDDKHTLRFMARSSKKQASYFSTDTKIFPEVRKNALILLGTEKNLQRIIDFINKYIDVPLEASESRLHIKELKYADAKSLEVPLKDIIKPSTGPDGKILQMGEYKFFEDVIITSDSVTKGESSGGNRLIIACNKEDWKRLSYFINKLDKPEPQVALEVVFVKVNINNEADLFSQFVPKKNPMFAGVSFYTVNS